MFPFLRLHLIVEQNGVAGPVTERSPRPDRPIGAAMLRRVLGKVLIERFCAFETPRCEAGPRDGGRQPEASSLCGLAGSCPYGVLFAPSGMARPPFALHMPPDASGGFDLVELTLLNGACQMFPWAVSSLRQALADGLGRSRSTFTVRQVLRVRADRGRQRLCDKDLRQLPSMLEPDLLGLWIDPLETGIEIEVHLLSPLRLIRDGRLLKPGAGSGPPRVPFMLLVARALDRLVGVYGHQARQLLAPELRLSIEAAAAEVQLLESDICWVEVPDYSARSGRELQLGGWIGRLVYGPEAGSFLQVLRVAEILHLGKNPTSGCGRIRVSRAERRQA